MSEKEREIDKKPHRPVRGSIFKRRLKRRVDWERLTLHDTSQTEMSDTVGTSSYPILQSYNRTRWCIFNGSSFRMPKTVARNFPVVRIYQRLHSALIFVCLNRMNCLPDWTYEHASSSASASSSSSVPPWWMRLVLIHAAMADTPLRCAYPSMANKILFHRAGLYQGKQTGRRSFIPSIGFTGFFLIQFWNPELAAHPSSLTNTESRKRWVYVLGCLQQQRASPC